MGIREDTCLSLAKGITIPKRPTTASTTGSPPLKRPQLLYKVHYIVTHNGRQLWDTRWPTSSNNSNSKIKIGGLCSSTSHPATSLSNHDNNQLGREGISIYLDKYFFSFYFI
jgi:hypothetical protein